MPQSQAKRILVVSDVVNREVYNERIRDLHSDIDLVLSCGDLPYDYLEYIVTMLDVPLLYVHGNHDRPLRTDRGEIPAPRGCISVEARVVSEGGLSIAGLGGSIRYKPLGAHQYTEGQMRWRIARLAPRLWWNRACRGRGLDIFLAHAPPRGVHDDEDPAHQGFESFRSFIDRHHPRYFIHGHTLPHTGVPEETRVGRTEVIHAYGHKVLEVRLGKDGG